MCSYNKHNTLAVTFGDYTINLNRSVFKFTTKLTVPPCDQLKKNTDGSIQCQIFNKSRNNQRLFDLVLIKVLPGN